MSEMVERVRAAIIDELGVDLGENGSAEYWDRVARAAIEAMREPSEAMVEAAHIAEPSPVLGGYALEEDGPRTVYRAMIDAAL